MPRNDITKIMAAILFIAISNGGCGQTSSSNYIGGSIKYHKGKNNTICAPLDGYEYCFLESDIIGLSFPQDETIGFNLYHDLNISGENICDGRNNAVQSRGVGKCLMNVRELYPNTTMAGTYNAKWKANTEIYLSPTGTDRKRDDCAPANNLKFDQDILCSSIIRIEDIDEPVFWIERCFSPKSRPWPACHLEIWNQDIAVGISFPRKHAENSLEIIGQVVRYVHDHRLNGG